MQKTQKLLLKGIPASIGSVTGKVRIIQYPEEIDMVTDAEIIVISFLHPDFLPNIKRNAQILGIISDKGGMTCHAAIVTRELKIPYIAGTEIATKKLKKGMTIRMDGKDGKIYG
jgi:pyruvate, water dikinase